jgi:hypothetical protein
LRLKFRSESVEKGSTFRESEAAVFPQHDIEVAPDAYPTQSALKRFHSADADSSSMIGARV